MPNLAEKRCETCGKTFEPGGNRQKYCYACGKFPRGACLACGTVFARNKKNSKYCSRDCSFSSARASHTKTCPICGTSFRARIHQQTCGRRCGRILFTRPARDQRRRSCVVCRAEFVHRVDRPETETCSRACGIQRVRNQGVGEHRRTKKGYVLLKVGVDYPGSKNGWILEHRYVVERRLGRQLLDTEHVHHKNGDRTDNRDENLELWTGPKQQPTGVRISDYHCPGCRCSER